MWYDNNIQLETLFRTEIELEKNKVDVYSLSENHKEFIKSKTLILKPQLRFRSKKHNAFTEEVNRIAMCAADDKIIQSID